VNNECEYYTILEISSESSLEDIKKAYKKLALKYHPDVYPDNGESFKKIKEAYTYLMDHHIPYKKDNENVVFSELFSEMFKAKSKIKHKQLVKIDISLKEALEGFEKVLNIFLEIPCTCNIFIRKECKICKGLGFIKKNKRQNFCFDNNIYQNQIFIFKDFYENIDLHIKFNILPEGDFKVRGKNIESEINLNIFKSILGGKFFAPTPKGSLEIELPPNKIQNYNCLLKNEGLNGGDHLIRFNIYIPNNLKKEHKELLKRILDETKDQTEDKD